MHRHWADNPLPSVTTPRAKGNSSIAIGSDDWDLAKAQVDADYQRLTADLANGWLKSYGLDYKLEQETLNSEIDKALTEYHSKSGGSGGNRPDAKLLLRNPKTQQDFPIVD